MSSSAKLKAKLASVNTALDELENELQPLLAQTLPETIVNLDPIQQAKLHVLIPYLTNGLLFGT
jgi:exosome complex protein LRP1